MRLLLLSLSAGALAAPDPAVEGLLTRYRAEGARPFSAEAGAALWRKPFPAASGPARTCATCHGEDLRAGGKHATTGEPIDPMAPAANAERYTDPAFVEKWFTRNCKWTFGRPCTPQEKGDFLTWLTTEGS